eukprot:TRINITY_DN6259_c0_g1_i1.p1 TRINITY_DN6259_c0_g1~~TRINITY_DN6259_c0_g1_i1.p1  ORF type:complete len:297 (+),score=54.95 TRINITY_DN6259_c0_g1_i1:63-893(+)
MATVEKNEFGFPKDKYDAGLKQLLKEVEDILPEGAHYNEDWVARFLRARQCNVDKSKQMLLESLEWRKKNNVDKVLEGPPPDSRIIEYLPHGFLGKSKEGYQIYLERTGLLCLPSPEVISLEALTHWKIHTAEYADHLIRDHEKKTCLVILDVSGLSLSRISKHVIDYVKMTGEVDEKNYPESLHKVLVLNAGFIFSTAYKMVQYFFAAEVRDKIRVFGGDYESELYKYVEPEDMPEFIKGGKKQVNEKWASKDMSYQKTLPQTVKDLKKMEKLGK